MSAAAITNTNANADAGKDAALRIAPEGGAAKQLFVLLHGVGGNAAGLLPLARLLRQNFPQAAVVVPEGTEPFDGGGAGRQWFSVRGVTEQNRPERVARALPVVEAMIRAEQAHYGVAPADTVMGGFSQGAIMSLSLAVQHDGLVGRVLSFSGRFAALPDTAPKHTDIHFLHGELDPVIPAGYARDAHARLQALGANPTLDVEKAAGHTLTPALADRAIDLLRTRAVLRGS